MTGSRPHLRLHPDCSLENQHRVQALLEDGWLLADPDTPSSLWLDCDVHGLRLSAAPTAGQRRGSVLALDFTQGRQAHRLRQAAHSNEPLLRALGRLPPDSLLLDASAGLGRDSLTLAARGHRVWACERHPVVAAVLADALQRAATDPTLAACINRINLYPGAVGQLPPPPAPFAGIIFDPMFPSRRKSAAVHQEMQLLQQLFATEPDADAPATLAYLHTLTSGRIVVKRPVHAPPLAGIAPSGSLTGSRIRLDIYRGQEKNPASAIPAPDSPCEIHKLSFRR